MFKTLQHIKFLFTATNQHGVHSPFVYNYVTKCLYTKPRYRYSKSVNVLLKSIGHFNPKQAIIADDKVQKIVQRYFPNLQFVETSAEIIWVSASEKVKLEVLLSQENIVQNDSLLVLDAIHSTKESYETWKEIKANEKVRVTLDLFCCGTVFFRKEQAKEHFKIRI